MDIKESSQSRDVQRFEDIELDKVEPLQKTVSRDEVEIFVSSQQFISNCCTTTHITTWLLLLSKNISQLLWCNMVIKMYGPLYIGF